jgi:hypothetical protein
MTWGVDAHVMERFGQAGVPQEKISMIKDMFEFNSPHKSPTQFIDLFRRFYGPTMNAFDAAEKMEKQISSTGNLWNWRKHRTKAATVVLRFLPRSCESPFPFNEAPRTSQRSGLHRRNATFVTCGRPVSKSSSEMAKAAHDIKLKHAFESHLEQTSSRSGCGRKRLS